MTINAAIEGLIAGEPWPQEDIGNGQMVDVDPLTFIKHLQDIVRALMAERDEAVEKIVLHRQNNKDVGAAFEKSYEQLEADRDTLRAQLDEAKEQLRSARAALDDLNGWTK